MDSIKRFGFEPESTVSRPELATTIAKKDNPIAQCMNPTLMPNAIRQSSARNRVIFSVLLSDFSPD